MIIFILASAYAFKIPLKLVSTPISGSTPSEFLSLFHVSNYYNSLYYASFLIGTPATEVTMLLDTGSTYLWVPSALCDSCTSAHKFNTSTSSTYKSLKTHLTIKYFGTNVTGVASTETIALTSNSNYTASNLLFVLVDSEGTEVQKLPTDGFIGLAFSTKLNGYLNFVDSLKSQGVIQRALFALYLSDNLLGEFSQTDPEASIMFGDYDMNYTVESELKFVRIYKESGFWFTKLDSVQLNGNNLTSSQYAIFHTGAPMIQGPAEDIKILVGQVTKNSYCYGVNNLTFCYCNDLTLFPTFDVNLDGKNFKLKPEFYMTRVSGWCLILMQRLEGSNALVLSLPFLRQYYSVFDLENARVGLGEARKSVPITTAGIEGLGAVIVGLGFFIGVVGYVWRRKYSGGYIRIE